MASETITIRVDSKLKENTTKVLEKLGLDMSTAIRIYLRQIVINDEIPFNIQTRPENRARFIGKNKNIGQW